MPRYATLDRLGQIAPEKLGRGVVSTETYLRGDGTWATVSSTGTEGPQGPPGADGADGADGAQGPAGPPGASVWGTITGTLSDQTDLQTALNGKSATSHQHFATYASLSHAHIVGDTTGLQTALDAKSETAHQHFAVYSSLSHAHAQADVTNLSTDLAGKSDTSHQHFAVYSSVSHAHIVGDTTGLQTELDGKSSTAHHHFAIYSSLSHAHAQSDVTNLASDLSGKSSTSHQHFGDYASLSHAHIIGDTTGLQTAIDGKSDTAHQHFSLYASLSHAHFGVYASLSHGHAGADITSGTIGPAFLGSGTPTAGTFLRGDSTWATPSGGSGAPTTAEYLVGIADAGLSAERVVASSTSCFFDIGTAGQASVIRAALTGDVTASVNSNAMTIPANTVTYAKMQDVTATSRFLGRITAGAGDPEELTGTQATTLLDNVTSGLKGLAPASGGGTTNFLRADATWAAPGGGSNPFTMAVATLNTGTNSNTVFATVNYVSLSVTASKRYIVEGFLIYRTALITTGLNLAWNVPSGTTLIGQSVVTNALLTASVLSNNAVASSSGASTAPVWVGANNPAYVWLLASLSTTGGKITPLFRSEVSASFATLQAYSMWRMMEIV